MMKAAIRLRSLPRLLWMDGWGEKDTQKIEEGEEGEEGLKCDHACDGGEGREGGGGRHKKGNFWKR